MMNPNMKVCLLAVLLQLSGAVLAQQPLSPEDDWVAALQAGGVVNLGPGAFLTNEYLELTNPVTIRGQGTGVTSLWFNSDGGEFGEQFVLLAPEHEAVRFEISDMDISYEGDKNTDLLVLWGDAHLSLTNVSVNYAVDAEAFAGEPSDFFRGSGLVLGKGATALVDSSVFYLNDTNGISAIGAARLVVTNSTFHENWWAGIYVLDTPVTVTRSHFESNDIGIQIHGAETRILSMNTFLSQYSQDTFEASAP